MFFKFKLFLIYFIVFIFSCGADYLNEKDIPELLYLDKSVDPCDNFYQYTCGNFKNVHPMPEEAKNWDHFSILQEEIHQIARHILESERKDSDPIAVQKSKSFYKACVDVDYAEYLNLPELSALDKLGKWPAIEVNPILEKMTWNGLGDIIAEYGVPFFLNFQVIPSTSNATQNVIYLSKDALKLPEAAIYGKLDETVDYLTLSDQQRGKRETEVLPFVKFLSKIAYKMTHIAGTMKPHEDIDREIEETMKFMRVIQGNGVFSQDAKIEPLGNTVSIKVLQNWTNVHFGDDYELNWVEFLNHVFKYTGVTINEEMTIFQGADNYLKLYGMINTFKIASAKQLNNFIVARLLTYMAPDSNTYMREVFTTFYEESGFTTYDRETYCVRSTLGYPSNMDLSLAVTHEYQTYHFNINKLVTANEMIVDLQAAFVDILKESSWMDTNSSRRAIQKANNIITLLAFPEYAEDQELLDRYYQNLRICTWDHFGNSQRLRAFRQAVQLSEIGVPKNRELWTFSPLEVNAMYNRGNNRILFPISMLNPVFFRGDVRALDYGRIGAVIGHEITHGFDNDGKLYNEEGVIEYPTWWSSETQLGFNTRKQCFEDQYSKYHIPEIDEYVNGTKTLNENIADNGGLRSSFLAFQKLKRRKAPMVRVENYSDEELFFIGYGTMWCMTETDYYLGKMRNSSGYAPGRYRVIGPVSNMKEFSEVFNCPVGSNMNPENKCILW